MNRNLRFQVKALVVSRWIKPIGTSIAVGTAITYDPTTNILYALGGASGSSEICTISPNASATTAWNCSTVNNALPTGYLIFRAVDKTEEVNNFMPDDLPEKPGNVVFPDNSAPSYNNSMFGSKISNSMSTNGQIVAMSANMKGAVYGIKGYYATSVVGFSKNNSSEGYVGAIYSYEKGYRVYIYTIFNKNRDMFGKTADWVVGKALTNDLDQGYSNAVQVRDKFLEAEPEAAIKRQDPPFLSQYKIFTLILYL